MLSLERWPTATPFRIPYGWQHTPAPCTAAQPCLLVCPHLGHRFHPRATGHRRHSLPARNDPPRTRKKKSDVPSTQRALTSSKRAQPPLVVRSLSVACSAATPCALLRLLQFRAAALSSTSVNHSHSPFSHHSSTTPSTCFTFTFLLKSRVTQVSKSFKVSCACGPCWLLVGQERTVRNV